MIDVICLFCLNPIQRTNDICSLSLTPCFTDVDLKSRVFNQPFLLVEWNVMGMPTYAKFKNKKNTNISITRRGQLRIKKTNYAPFWKSTNLLMKHNKRNLNAS